MNYIRLDKFICSASSLSRKEAAKAIRIGRIAVNGTVIKDIGFKTDKDTDKVFLDDKQIFYKENYYIMLNKPQGYLSATEDRHFKTVMDLIDANIPKEKLFPAGRLDKDTEGFLFLTTDGPMAHKITGPKNHVPKKYYVILDMPLKYEYISVFSAGMELENGEKCKSAELSIIDEKSCYLTLTEGKFHQVKRMFLMLGLTVQYLKRVQIGGLMLDESLKTGEYRELTSEEVYKICLKK